MPKSSQRAEQLERAAKLAEALGREGVTRNELRSFLSPLFSAPGSWEQRRDRTRKLAELLPSSWVANRAGGTRSRLISIGRIVGPILAGATEDDCAFVLGWTARLLQIARLKSASADEDYGEPLARRGQNGARGNGPGGRPGKR
jgi:hypothetical protein